VKARIIEIRTRSTGRRVATVTVLCAGQRDGSTEREMSVKLNLVK
jgi:hypothetical protein